MLSQERKDEFYDKMLRLIMENCNDDEDLFNALVKVMGMTQEELNDQGIYHLDDFFCEHKASEELQARMDRAYLDFVAEWMTWTRRELIDHCAQIEAVTRMEKTAVPNMTEEDAEYMLRFENPLAVLADQWRARFDMDALLIDDDISQIVWRIKDQGLDDLYETVEQDNSGMRMG